ncbi:hypothetical protein ABI59_22085 [Acidobacteria bacterium Mor1]|nr:hypothetical protein ABI59_22085 [Acidobacteria bacterium Mor1]
MKRLTLLLLIGLAWSASPAGHYDYTERRNLEKTFELQSGEVYLRVDNVFGSITVRGHDASRIEIQADERLRARSPEKLARAKEETELLLEQDGNDINVYAEAPYRYDQERRGRWRDHGYEAYYDIEILVPHRARIHLSTVNQGEVLVEDVRGDFKLNNINGPIEMLGAAGDGEATTINGDVRIRFAENPTESSHFSTINGDLDFSFTPSLSAELRFKTQNGEIWTDFQAKPIPASSVKEMRDGEKRILKAQRWAAVQVAGGGPTLSFSTLNGDILIRDDGR